MRRVKFLWVLGVAALGCGDGSESLGDAAMPLDASGLDGGEPFDPSRTYEGEGDPCSMSIECEFNQICVDDQCSRHERFAADELSLGEMRRSTEEMVAATSIDLEARWPWSELNTGGNFLISPEYWNSQRFSVGGQPALGLIHYSLTRCQALLFGPSIQVFSVEGMICSAMDVSDGGAVTLVGLDHGTLEGRVVVFDVETPTPSLDMGFEPGWSTTMAASAGESVRAIVPTSALISGGSVYVAFGLDSPDVFDDQFGDFRALPAAANVTGDHEPRWTAFARFPIDLPEGEPELITIDDEVVLAGHHGWLGHGGGGVQAVLTVRPTGGSSPFLEVDQIWRLTLAPVPGGREMIYESAGISRELIRQTNTVLVGFKPADRCGPVLVDLITADETDFSDARSEFACSGAPVPSLGLSGLLPETTVFRGGEVLAMGHARGSLGPTEGSTFIVRESGMVESYPPEDEGALALAMPAVSRFGKTVELIEQAYTSQGLGVVELALSTTGGTEP